MAEMPTLREISVASISQLCMFAMLLVHAAVEMASTSYAAIFILGSTKMGESIQTCTRTTIIWELTKNAKKCKKIIIFMSHLSSLVFSVLSLNCICSLISCLF